ncbi:MAG: PilZ domain-containing protein [Archangiaceae bacterium]|nr:PilZ domain-containing protein [Archangiaceae bacterium]
MTQKLFAVVETHAEPAGRVQRLLEQHLPLETVESLDAARVRLGAASAAGVLLPVGAIGPPVAKLATEVFEDGGIALLFRGGGTLEVLIGGPSPSRLWATRWDEATLRPIAGRGKASSRIAAIAEQALAQSLERAAETGKPVAMLAGMLEAGSGLESGPAGSMQRLMDAVGAALLPTGSPELYWYSQGAVFCALPEVTRSAVVDAAWRAQRTFVRRQQRDRGAVPVHPHFAAAVFPTDASTAATLLRCALDGLSRCQELGRQVVEVVPTVLFASPHGPLRSVGDLLERVEITRVECEEDDVALKITELRPAAVLMNVLGSRTALDQLAGLLKLKQYRHIQVVLASPKEPNPQYLARASKVPNATVVMGKQRFKPRTLEALATAVGVKQRRHLRHSERIEVAVVRAGDEPLKGRLLNVSESGALLATPNACVPDERFSIGFTLPEGPLVARVRVVRCRPVAPGYELGVEFEGLPGDQQHMIGRFVVAGAAQEAQQQQQPEAEEEVPRVSPRVPLERRMKIKVRLRRDGSKVTNYLRMIDLSESGFLAVAALGVEPALEVGALAEALLFGSRGSVSCRARVVRRQRGDSGELRLAMQIVELAEGGQAQLRALLKSARPARKVG